MNNQQIMVLNTVLSDSSSSSSSSNSDIDEEYIINERHHRCNQNRKKPRVENFIENVVSRYAAQEFKDNFRLSRPTFEYLLYILRPNLEAEVCGFGKMPISPEKQLYLALYVLGTPDSYRSVVTKFDVGKSTAWRAVRRVVFALCKLRNYFIKWPTAEEALATFFRIERRYGFPNVLGAVDGTHIEIPAPRRDSQSYINRKGKHTIQLKVICNDKLEFIHCYADLPGSVHDMRVFRYSGVQQRCNEQYFYQNSHLLGDSAYTIQRHVMVPYRNNVHLTVEQVHFNNVLSRTRMMVERSIGLLKMRWRYLIEKLPMKKTTLVPYYILCCCIMHNICLKQNDTFEYPILIPDTIDENLEPFGVNDISRQHGITKREEIDEFLNQDIQ